MLKLHKLGLKLNSTDLIACICQSIVDNAFMTHRYLFNHNPQHSMIIKLLSRVFLSTEYALTEYAPGFPGQMGELLA